MGNSFKRVIKEMQGKEIIICLGIIIVIITISFCIIVKTIQYVNSNIPEQLVKNGNVNFSERDSATIKELNDLTKYLYKYNSKNKTLSISTLSELNSITAPKRNDIRKTDSWKDPDNWGEFTKVIDIPRVAGNYYIVENGRKRFFLLFQTYFLFRRLSSAPKKTPKNLHNIAKEYYNDLEIFFMDYFNGATSMGRRFSDWSTAYESDELEGHEVYAYMYPNDNNGVILFKDADSYFRARYWSANELGTEGWLRPNQGIFKDGRNTLEFFNNREMDANIVGHLSYSEFHWTIEEIKTSIDIEQMSGPILYNDGYNTEGKHGYKDDNVSAVVDSLQITRVFNTTKSVYRGYFQGNIFYTEREISLTNADLKTDQFNNAYVPIYCFDANTEKAYICGVLADSIVNEEGNYRFTTDSEIYVEIQ